LEQHIVDCRVFGATYTGLVAVWIGTLPHTRGGRVLATTDGVWRVLATTSGTILTTDASFVAGGGTVLTTNANLLAVFCQSHIKKNKNKNKERKKQDNLKY
jgi:hypothetical protein